MKSHVPPDVLAAWQRGEKIEALRALREITELSLNEAKTLLESGDTTEPASVPHRRGRLPAAVLAALARGDRIQAIKLARQTTGLGLMEAKEAVEAASSGAPTPVRRPARLASLEEEPRTPIHWLGIAQFLALAALALLVVVKLLHR